MSDWLTLARIVRPQGRRGEVLCDLLTDFPGQFTGGFAVSLLRPDGTRTPATIDAHWLPVGRSAGRVVLQITGISDISAAETLAKCDVQIPQEQRIGLDDGTFYVTDLVGCTLADGANEIGVVQDLHFPYNADGKILPDAAALFVVQRPNGDEVMIPFANAFIRSIDVAAKRIEMNLPTGLVEMNG